VFANQALLDWLQVQRVEDAAGLLPGEVLDCVHAGKHGQGCGATEFCRTCGALRALTSSAYGQESIQECRIVQESGDALDLRVWATPLTVQGRHFTLVVINDISHEKRRRALERIFFHDVLNTAGSVLGFAKLLLDTPAEDHEDMAVIIRDLAQQLVEEIRAQQMLASAESGDLNIQTVTVNSLSAVREAVNLCANHDIAMDRVLHVDPESEATDFDSDPVLLRRVLSNMIMNGLEACTPGQTVTAGCHTAGNDEIIFRVHNPQYMSREVQLQIFQRSFSTKGAGRGLGTYSIKLLGERYLQGHAGFTTSRESGTVFTARFSRRLLPPWMVA
jgi:signal transduction histidine kinase